ncbi:1,2-dihydroxy-3-keto-5-methylthiopentene dioxygenase homolog 2-like [Zingiber officinale]|uniref:1,2-dihydroxy-3-keto-5-methylthiopentene dioxygenase homolog 2-like n=1 Tax=Zingiber officinale TaxID=94328 RepID=UPI001C4D84C6|nr:1,2-dihydroxy-3-keto-5-methylthiopentene dioxygenase homolog 2-like [Zingiber officinale]
MAGTNDFAFCYMSYLINRVLRRRLWKLGTSKTVRRKKITDYLNTVSPRNLFGIRTWRVGSDYENEEQVKQIRESRGYSHSCILDLHPERLPNFEQILKKIFVEHLHLDDEISYCIQGSGYHDVRDENDRWIRIAVKEGVMILLPAGIYHRLALDLNNYLKILIFNAGPAVGITTYERPGDDLPARCAFILSARPVDCLF